MENVLAQKFNAKGLIQFTLPTMVMMAFIAICTLAGNIFAARYVGEYALAAVSVVFPFVSMILAIAIMYATGSTAIVSANLGAKEYDKARENFSRITWIAFITGFALMVFTLCFKTQIALFLGATPQIIGFSEDYLTAYAFTVIFLFFEIFAMYFFVVIGKSMYSLYAILVGGVLNILTTYLLVSVFELGVIATAIGLGVFYAIPALCFLAYFSINRKGVLYFVKPKTHKHFFLNTCTNGSSEMVTNLAISATVATINIIMVNLEGESGIAAASVNGQMQFLMNSIFIGFGAGVAPIFGYAHGERNGKQTRRIFRLSVRFIVTASFLLILFCLFAANSIISLFLVPDSKAFVLAQNGFKLFTISFLFSGINIFASVFFTSVSNGKISALISFLRTFLFIFGMLMILPEILGVTGVWLAIPIAEGLTILVSILLFRKYLKMLLFDYVAKKKTLVAEKRKLV